MKSWHLRIALSLFAGSLFLIPLTGCGGGAYQTPAQASPQPSADNLDGPWEFTLQSDVVPDTFIILEANLALTNKHLVSETNGALLFQAHGQATYTTLLKISRLGGGCHDSGPDDVTFDGIVEDPKSGNQPITFTLTENSTLGSAVITASTSLTSTGSISGTYTLPAACGLPEDHGTILGYKDSATFSASDVYHGSLAGKSASLWFSSSPPRVDATGGGIYDGASISLAGFASGDALTMTGVISGQEITWFALYDSIYNKLWIYDSDANLLGTLTGP
jgi:hypothetical protein